LHVNAGYRKNPATKEIVNFDKMNHLFFAIIIFPIAGLCQPADELRKSVYFDGGSYYIDSAQVAELTHWLIPSRR